MIFYHQQLSNFVAGSSVFTLFVLIYFFFERTFETTLPIMFWILLTSCIIVQFEKSNQTLWTIFIPEPLDICAEDVVYVPENES